MRVEELETEQPALARRRPWRPAAALALAAVMAAFVVLLAAGGPAVEQVLAVAARPATAPAALDRGFEGVRFPRYEKWRATGERTDVVDGRSVRTVFYEGRDGRVIAYAIVAGPALSAEEALRVVRDDGVVAVTWTRDGRTCVIAARRWRRGRAGSAGRLVAPANCGWVGKRGFRRRWSADWSLCRSQADKVTNRPARASIPLPQCRG